MKKIMMIIMLLLCSSFVIAENNVVDSQGKGIENALMNLDKAEIQVKSTLKARELVQAMERFQERHQEKLYDCEENCKIRLETSVGQRDTAMLQIQRQAKFFWADVSLEVDYEIDDAGEIVDETRNFWQRLYEFRLVELE